MTKNFVNFHILISHSPSCLNRDDMNMQKTAVFGGKRRVRYSSQSLKRTLRKSAYYKKHLGESSIRTRELDELKKLFIDELKNEFDEAIVIKAMDNFVKDTKKMEDDDSDELIDSNKTEEKKGKLAVAPWILSEIKIICSAVKTVIDQGLSHKEKEKAQSKFEKQPKKGNKKPLNFFENQIFNEKIEDILSKNSEQLSKAIGSALDVAFSGRMATSGLMTKIDGALAISHPITTHIVDSDIDWFTAVDDLQELGSGHLDTQEFSSGVFYRYASLNISQLQENLGGASRERALEIAAHLLHMLATEVPSAKQQSFAAHNLADLALVSLTDIPVSLINAFESPVTAKSEGLLRPSISALHDYWENVHNGYNLNEDCVEFTLFASKLPSGITKKDNLQSLETWIKNDGKDI